ncbi:unnamed protein product [Calypogeia fissa]
MALRRILERTDARRGIRLDFRKQKRARGVLTSNIGSENVASLRRENEELRCGLQAARDILNQCWRLTEKSESHLREQKIEDEEASTLSRAKESLPDSAKGIDVQLMLEVRFVNPFSRRQSL